MPVYIYRYGGLKLTNDNSFEHYTAYEVLEYAVSKYGDRITFASSFGAEDVVIIDLLSKVAPSIDIFFLDTDLHFPETYETIERLQERYGRSFTCVRPELSLAQQREIYGDRLWEQDPDLCCRLRKVEPLKTYLQKFDAWITGIRREQSPTRAHAQKIEYDTRFSLMKFNPLVDWSYKQVWSYIMEHQVPYNPLHDLSYPSIGCAVCTQPVAEGEDIRNGRWRGFAKTECGLHK